MQNTLTTLSTDLEKAITSVEGFTEALSFCYEEDSRQSVFHDVLNDISVEGLLYGKHIHTCTLKVVKTILHLTEWLLETGDITFESFPIGLSFVFTEGIQLTEPLRTSYRKILLRLGALGQKIQEQGARIGGRNIQGTSEGTRKQLTDNPTSGSGISIGNRSKALISSFRESEGDVHHGFLKGGPKKQLRRRLKSTVANPFRRNRLKDSQNRDWALISCTLQNLISAIQSLAAVIESAAVFLTAVYDPLTRRQSLDPVGDRDDDSSSVTMGLTKRTVECCKNLLLSELDQYITFVAIDVKLDESVQENWLSQIVGGA